MSLKDKMELEDRINEILSDHVVACKMGYHKITKLIMEAIEREAIVVGKESKKIFEDGPYPDMVIPSTFPKGVTDDQPGSESIIPFFRF